MLIGKPDDIPTAQVTDKNLYLRRRDFIGGAAAAAVMAAITPIKAWALGQPNGPHGRTALTVAERKLMAGGETVTSYKSATHYNNFYEFSTTKEEVADMARGFTTEPWTVRIEGEVKKPMIVDIEQLIMRFALEERAYRMRCVEAWSMVIPWVGFPIKKLIDWVQPTSKAKYMVMTTLNDPKRMPGLRAPILDWPYVEALRMDEAMNDLSMLAVGMYGETLPPQNGAPLRLVVPWKYGFKSVKSIVKIEFLENRPHTTWNISSPREYGFFANVNPAVDHPRWSQAKERRIGEFRKRKTLPFNGYGEQVAALYSGMDLRKQF